MDTSVKAVGCSGGQCSGHHFHEPRCERGASDVAMSLTFRDAFLRPCWWLCVLACVLPIPVRMARNFVLRMSGVAMRSSEDEGRDFPCLYVFAALPLNESRSLHFFMGFIGNDDFGQMPRNSATWKALALQRRVIGFLSWFQAHSTTLQCSWGHLA